MQTMKEIKDEIKKLYQELTLTMTDKYRQELDETDVEIKNINNSINDIYINLSSKLNYDEQLELITLCDLFNTYITELNIKLYSHAIKDSKLAYKIYEIIDSPSI